MQMMQELQNNPMLGQMGGLGNFGDMG